MIIVDDGSDDGTPDIAESFNDPRIVVIRRTHEGVAGLGRSYALAVARAKGEFFAILECDDTWPTTKLEDELPMFNDPEVVLAYGSAELMDQKGRVYGRVWHAPHGHVARNEPIGAILPALVNVNFIVAVTVMIRRSALEQVGGFFQPDGIPYVDHPTWLRLATVGKFARSRRDLGRWRRHASQITTRSWFDSALDRSSYLQTIAAESRGFTSPAILTAMAVTIKRDSTRQHEEIVIARGRVALLEGHWRGAAALFAQLVRRGAPRNRLIATLGLACAGCRMDMEFAIRLMGRHSLPSRRHFSSHGEPRPNSWTT
jgi:glycosyltransferase involved in cell wall biosynthesis